MKRNVIVEKLINEGSLVLREVEDLQTGLKNSKFAGYFS